MSPCFRSVVALQARSRSVKAHRSPRRVYQEMLSSPLHQRLRAPRLTSRRDAGNVSRPYIVSMSEQLVTCLRRMQRVSKPPLRNVDRMFLSRLPLLVEPALETSTSSFSVLEPHAMLVLALFTDVGLGLKLIAILPILV